MKCLNIIASPLEQFEILPLISLNFGLLDFSITNQTIILALISFIFVTYFLSFLKQSDNSLFIIPSRWQVIVEFVYSLVLNVVAENIGGKKSEKFFPLVFYHIYLYLIYEFDRVGSI